MLNGKTEQEEKGNSGEELSTVIYSVLILMILFFGIVKFWEKYKICFLFIFPPALLIGLRIYWLYPMQRV